MIDKEYNFLEFDEVNKEKWIAQVEKDLKGKPIESLNWNINEKEYSPFYSKENMVNIPPLISDLCNGWLNLQHLNISHKNFDQWSMEALNNGADGLILELTNDDSLKEKIKGIFPEHCHLSLAADHDCIPIANEYTNYIEGLSIDKGSVNGLGFWHELVELKVEQQKILIDLDKLVAIIKANQCANFRNLLIDVSKFSQPGISPAEEIGYSLALMVQIINGLLDRGIELDTIASNIFFSLKASDQYFVEIAKLRTLKLLVREIFNLYDKNLSDKVHVHMNIFSEEHYNYIKSTSEAMSSVLGGANSISILPYQDVNQNARIARNISSIIKEEAYLDKNSDVAAGSYFIETLTFDIAKDSWTIFSECEHEGGIVKSLENGRLNKLFLDN